MKDWDHIEWEEYQKARRKSGTPKSIGTKPTLKGGDGDGARAAKREQEEGKEKRDSDASWYGTTT